MGIDNAVKGNIKKRVSHRMFLPFVFIWNVLAERFGGTELVYGNRGLWTDMFLWMALTATGMWKVYRKIGLPGWAAIIPVYRSAVLSKFLFKREVFGILPGLIVLCGFAPFILGLSDSVAFMPAVILGIPLCFIWHAISKHKLATLFGRSLLFTLGLVFLPPVFAMLLGFGTATDGGVSQSAGGSRAMTTDKKRMYPIWAVAAVATIVSFVGFAFYGEFEFPGMVRPLAFLVIAFPVLSLICSIVAVTTSPSLHRFKFFGVIAVSSILLSGYSALHITAYALYLAVLAMATLGIAAILLLLAALFIAALHVAFAFIQIQLLLSTFRNRRAQ